MADGGRQRLDDEGQDKERRHVRSDRARSVADDGTESEREQPEDRNEQAIGKEERITRDDSRLHAFVIPTDEELLIARDTVRCILGEPHPS